MPDEQPPARRDSDRSTFVVTSLASGFAAAVAPVQAQTTITTDSAGLRR